MDTATLEKPPTLTPEAEPDVSMVRAVVAIVVAAAIGYGVTKLIMMVLDAQERETWQDSRITELYAENNRLRHELSKTKIADAVRTVVDESTSDDAEDERP